MVIEQGDIIFFKSDGSWWDWFIHLVSPNHTHVGIALDEHRMVDASVRGVGISPIHVGVQITVVQVRGVDRDKIKDGLIYALQIASTRAKYAYVEAVLSGILRLLGLRFVADKINNEWFCSEFATRVIRSKYGVNVVPGTAVQSVMPDELLSDPNMIIKTVLGGTTSGT